MKAFITDAGRGIGRATAPALASAGLDVAVSARTVEPGEVRDDTLTVHRSDTRPLPGGRRLVHALRVEFAGRGVLAFNVDPGYVATERNKISVADYGREITGAAPPEAIGAVMAWLATAPDRAAPAGTAIDAQRFARGHDLHPARV